MFLRKANTLICHIFIVSVIPSHQLMGLNSNYTLTEGTILLKVHSAM